MTDDLWETNARWWQSGFTEGADAEYEEQILPLAKRHLKGAKRVLDVGTGEGQVARLAPGFVVGVDPTEAQVLEAARRRGKPRYGRADATALPFRDEFFDAVVACLVFEHIDDADAAIAEVARVLAPGGRLLFDTINRTAWAWFVAIFGSERVVGLVPAGTHDWRLFIRPSELDRLLRACDLAAVSLVGLAPRIGPGDIARGLLTRRLDPPSFDLGPDRRASYLGHYRKRAA